MTYQMKSVRVLQTSLIAAILYFALSLLICIPLFLIALVMPHTGNDPFSTFGSIFFLFLPFLYAILGFIFSSIGCLIYNLVAKFTGGIAFTLEEVK